MVLRGKRVLAVGASVLAMASVAGCGASATSTSSRSAACVINPSSCMYDGAYEPDERAYAEEEAGRLNRSGSVRRGRR